MAKSFMERLEKIKRMSYVSKEYYGYGMIEKVIEATNNIIEQIEGMKKEYNGKNQAIEYYGYNTAINDVLELLKSVKKPEKKYQSCTSPKGEYCKKHGVIHKKEINNERGKR